MGREDYAPPGPPPGYYSNNNASQCGQGHVSWGQSGNRSSEQASQYPHHSAHMQPPQGPPPSSSQQPPEYQPPPGPPPSHSAAPPEYEAPPGPPPSWQGDKKAPPPSDQSNEPEPPPYDPWMAVPDNALLPPPPSFFKEIFSPGANASKSDDTRALTWCKTNPLAPPHPHPPQLLSTIHARQIHLTSPPSPRHPAQLTHSTPSSTRLRTSPKTPDTTFLTTLPLYPARDLLTRNPPPASHTIYFEATIHALPPPHPRTGDVPAGLALGFLAPPYPPFRLPGWHRGSLAVHSDDGHRYVDDGFGGKPFVAPFRRGETVGVGMTFSARGERATGWGKVEVFFVRNGKREGGWEVFEERDVGEEGGVSGLGGECDLLGAVGVFGQVECEVRFWGEGGGWDVRK